MELLDPALKPYHIVTLEKDLDMEELKNTIHRIDERYLMTILEYHDIKE